MTSTSPTWPDRRLGWLAVGAGFVLALAVQMAAPVGVPLYDGVVVQEPYRYLNPTGDQAGDPTSFSRTVAVQSSISPVLVAATAENPTQAQLNGQRDAIRLTPGATSLMVSIAPIEPPAAPPDGTIAGNVYRFSVTDQAGAPLAPNACEGCLTLALRGPEDLGGGTLRRFADGEWTDVTFVHAGMLGFYQANITALGDYAIIAVTEPGTGPDPVLIVGGVALLLLLAGGAFLLFRVKPVPAAPTSGGPRPSRIPSKRRRPRTPPSERSNR